MQSFRASTSWHWSAEWRLFRPHRWTEVERCSDVFRRTCVRFVEVLRTKLPPMYGMILSGHDKMALEHDGLVQAT